MVSQWKVSSLRFCESTGNNVRKQLPQREFNASIDIGKGYLILERSAVSFRAEFQCNRLVLRMATALKSNALGKKLKQVAKKEGLGFFLGAQHCCAMI
jgi:hypothetical protein